MPQVSSAFTHSSYAPQLSLRHISGFGINLVTSNVGPESSSSAKDAGQHPLVGRLQVTLFHPPMDVSPQAHPPPVCNAAVFQHAAQQQEEPPGVVFSPQAMTQRSKVLAAQKKYVFSHPKTPLGLSHTQVSLSALRPGAWHQVTGTFLFISLSQRSKSMYASSSLFFVPTRPPTPPVSFLATTPTPAGAQ